jgi:hypothetical protein
MSEMAPTDANQVAVELAELRGTITTFMNTWKTQDDRAAESRRGLYQGQTDLKVAVGGLTRDLAEVVNDVAEIRPKVKTLESVYNRGWGVVWAVRVLGGCGLVAFGWMIAHFTPFSLHVR